MTASSLRPIAEVARDLGVADEHLIAYGTDKAKIRLEARQAALDGGRAPGKLVLVTAVTPTDA
ncbi:MAG: formate--tetrahydrofolate ligase, partial [Acidobacteriota bacterium]